MTKAHFHRPERDVPTKKEMQAIGATLDAEIDRRGLRSPGEKRQIERTREGVRRRQAARKNTTTKHSEKCQRTT